MIWSAYVIYLYIAGAPQRSELLTFQKATEYKIFWHGHGNSTLFNIECQIRENALAGSWRGYDAYETSKALCEGNRDFKEKFKGRRVSRLVGIVMY